MCVCVCASVQVCVCVCVYIYIYCTACRASLEAYRAAHFLLTQLTNNEAEMTEFLNENNIPLEEEAGVMFTLERYVLAGTSSVYLVMHV